jgi:hypothetical protein
MSINENLVQANFLKLLREKYIGAVKCGCLEDVVNIYNSNIETLKTFLTSADIANLFEPVKSDDDNIFDCPFVIAMLSGRVDLCIWMYNVFKDNIISNANSLPEYICIDEVCENGHLDVLKFIDEVFHDVVRCGDYHNDTFLLALENKHYDILEYLYTMYGEKFVLTDSCNVNAVIRDTECGRFNQDHIIYYVSKLINICPDMNLGAACLKTIHNAIKK